MGNGLRRHYPRRLPVDLNVLLVPSELARLERVRSMMRSALAICRRMIATRFVYRPDRAAPLRSQTRRQGSHVKSDSQASCPTIAMNAGEFGQAKHLGPPCPLAPVSPRKLARRRRRILLLGS